MPSQFSIDGRQFAFEAHMIHSNMNNGSDTLVVVLLFEAGGANPLLDDMLPPASIANPSLPLTLHLKKYLPSYQNYYYLGPQTITQANRNVSGNPSCTYSVAQTWLLLETPLNCSLAQLQRVMSLAFPSPVAPAGSVPPSTQPTTFPKYVSQVCRCVLMWVLNLDCSARGSVCPVCGGRVQAVAGLRVRFHRRLRHCAVLLDSQPTSTGAYLLCNASTSADLLS